MNKSPLPTLRPTQRGLAGFALIEGLIAILIFSLGILGLVGLQATSTQATTLAKTRIDASFVASQRIADIWGNVAGIASMTESNTTVSGLPNGKRTTSISGNVVTVTVTWQMPNDTTTYNYKAVAQIASN